ncbi:MAG: hypothetical protein PHT03_03590 [Bacilli bacterium]|nr:hypothetical protein [Bacilli bacterium]
MSLCRTSTNFIRRNTRYRHFCQNCEIGFNSPEAYEKLLYNVMRGEATLFARWDEVESGLGFYRFDSYRFQQEKTGIPQLPSRYLEAEGR